MIYLHILQVIFIEFLLVLCTYSRSLILRLNNCCKNNDIDCRALKPPGWQMEWHCGVRVKKSKKLVGFISAIPAHIQVYDK